jgi:chemotaxis protein methyltransferase CheR
VARYCTRVSPEEFEVQQRLRAVVHVGRLDLLRNTPPLAAYDLILCRNVIIYFDRPTQERLMEAFRLALAPGGYLVLGKVETIFGSTREQLQLVEPRERIYRRPA